MDKVKEMSQDEFNRIAVNYPFDRVLLSKDYHVTLILYLLKDIQGIYFKGGTALNKIFLSHARLSEDVDFTITGDLEKIKGEIIELLKESKLFIKFGTDKDVEGFTRIVVCYKGFSGEENTVFIDLNKRAKLALKPEEHEIKHFYLKHIPKFSVKTLAKEEMIAEKVAATVGRNKPRDHFDVYKIIKTGVKINLNLVKKKCKESGHEFSVLRMFNNAKKLKNRWDKDMEPLLAEEISFQKVITTLAKYFKLKEEKDNLKKK